MALVKTTQKVLMCGDIFVDWNRLADGIYAIGMPTHHFDESQAAVDVGKWYSNLLIRMGYNKLQYDTAMDNFAKCSLVAVEITITKLEGNG